MKMARGLKSSQGETKQFVPERRPSIAMPLSNPTAPDSPLWNNSAAICVCMRDENAADVREWLQYYR